jgi:hypothetical protein
MAYLTHKGSTEDDQAQMHLREERYLKINGRGKREGNLPQQTAPRPR